ncbi:MAG: ATP synthase F1 subunit delta [Chlorobi bacterium]|nr:ATP synthase F1 subunit delta [Chlorobiota bacterium]MCI0715092.1 ATP synthase F1 subunit delta [Chlorobiota bacterium]
MTNRKVARRYNLALYEIAEETNSVDSVKKDLEDIKKSISGSRELLMFILTPMISLDKKSKVIKELFSGKINGLTLKFLLVLCDKNRINILNDIADDFINLAKEKAGIVSAKIKTAVEISDKEKTSLAAKLKKYVGKEIEASYAVDPSIKGGFVAMIDDKIIDASILRQLELLREKFAQGRFNN